MSSGKSAVNSAEKLLLAEALDTLETFDDEPDHEIYIQAKLLTKILERLKDFETKRLFILYYLYDILGTEDNLPVRQLIDALQDI